ncbi:MAG TPA: WecB/TagA/CpsF family glycosyltransferase [Solirubrobacteraceae bacterium]|nr:WecB/TagA/CpsF family glycosyltransferase [Solirubrobacteraceae bacterium]
MIPADPSPSSASAPGPPAPPPTVEIVGTSLAATDYEEVMDWIDATVAANGRVCLTAAAVHLVMVAREDPETRAAVDRALAVPDGQPLVWAMRALGHRRATRVYGPDLMANYCERSARTGVKMYLYGGRNQGALVQLTLELRRRFPGLDVVGGYSPPFRPLTDEEEARVIAEIDGSGAQVVWVGTGQPKQERWMARMRDRLDAPVLVGVGAAFDFHAGLVAQAPPWMQRIGLEWLFRLSREPRRLWRRYARYNPLFVWGFARQYAASRRRSARR